MKSMIKNGLLSLLLISLIIGCNTKKTGSSVSADQKEQIKKEIQTREDEFADFYNSGELKGIGYYADDAITFYPNMAPIVSKEERLEFLKSDLESNSNKISFTTNEVFVSNDGNQVLEIGHYKVVDSTNTAINTGNYMSLFEKRDGKYVCLRDMSTSDKPAQ